MLQCSRFSPELSEIWPLAIINYSIMSSLLTASLMVVWLPVNILSDIDGAHIIGKSVTKSENKRLQNIVVHKRENAKRHSYKARMKSTRQQLKVPHFGHFAYRGKERLPGGFYSGYLYI